CGCPLRSSVACLSGSRASARSCGAQGRPWGTEAKAARRPSALLGVVDERSQPTPVRSTYTPLRRVARFSGRGSAALAFPAVCLGAEESLTRPRCWEPDGAPSRCPLTAHVAARSTRIGRQRRHERVRARARVGAGGGGGGGG